MSFDLQAFAQSVTKDKRTMEMFRYLLNNSYIRVINYHRTNKEDIPRFEAEIKYYAEHFSPVTVEDMDRFFDTGVWHKERPGLIPAIFEGYRCHYDYMLPILDKYNFTGWFYVPGFFMDVPYEEQLEFAQGHHLRTDIPEEYRHDKRIAMSWEEMEEISRRHVICCHTGSHFQITKTTSDEDMQREIVESKRRIESHIQKPVDVFCWLYGEEYSYYDRAHKFIEEAGYKYVVGNLKMERVRK